MTRKLIIHIGNHKTGTSSIQQVLFRNKDGVRKQGYDLFHENPDGSTRNSGNALTCVKFKLKRGHKIEGKVRKWLPKALCDTGHNVIISAETLSWLFSAKEIQKFQINLSQYFDDIKVVAYIRRQDMQAVSQYQQASKYGAFVAARFYQGGTRALPPYKEYFHKYLNYHQRLGMWADAFGEQNLLIRVFETNRLYNGDVVDDFFQVTDLMNEGNSTRINQSSGFEKTKVGHLISEQQFSLPVWRALTKYLDNTGKLVPDREEAAHFYSEFEESNRQLNERFSIHSDSPLFDTGFSRYPEQSTDQWTEDSANNAIRNLLKGIKGLSTFDQQDIELIRECAEKLNATVADRASNLRKMLDKYINGDGSSLRVKGSLQSRIKSFLR